MFKSVGLQRVRISQTVVATGKTYHLEAQVMVKVRFRLGLRFQLHRTSVLNPLARKSITLF